MDINNCYPMLERYNIRAKYMKGVIMTAILIALAIGYFAGQADWYKRFAQGYREGIK